MGDNTKGDSRPKITKGSLLRSPTITIILPMIIGLQLGWVYLRQTYVPPEERRHLVIVDRILKFFNKEE